jgi:Tol biopolymer transport system component
VIGKQPERFHSPRISPDGRLIVVDVVTADGRDVWLHSGTEGDLRRLTFQRDGHDPVWDADGRTIYYLSGDNTRLDVHKMLIGSAAPPTIEPSSIVHSYTGTPLPGGREWLTTTPAPDGRGLNIVRWQRGGERVDSLVGSAANETYPVPSPDGKWFAYTSDQSGRSELFVRSLVGGDEQLQISVDGASEPIWSRDGREVFYRRQTSRGAELVAARLDLSGTPRVVSRTSLFDVSLFDAAQPHANYDVSPDGQSFVFVRRSSSGKVTVIQNVAELARRLAQEARGGSR